MNIYVLKKLVIIISISGILFLIIYSYFFNINTYSVSDFLHSAERDKFLEKSVSLYGTIREPQIRNTHLFFRLCSGSSCIDCVIFNYKQFQKEIIFNTSKIKVTGKYTIYNDLPEIIVNRLENVDSWDFIWNFIRFSIRHNS